MDATTEGRLTMGLRKQTTLIEKAQDAAEHVRPQVEAAVDQAVGYAQEGLKHAAPLIEQGKVKAGATLAEGAKHASPLIEQGKVKAGATLATAAALAAEAADSAQHFVEEKTAELKHEEPKHKGGKLKKFVLITGLLAVVGVIA